VAGWLAERVPYRPAPAWIVQRRRISPAFVTAAANGAFLLSFGLWWTFIALWVPGIGAAVALFGVPILFMVGLGAPWLLVRKEISGYGLAALGVVIELRLVMAYANSTASWSLVRNALAVGLAIVVVEVGWLTLRGLISREQPHSDAASTPETR